MCIYFVNVTDMAENGALARRASSCRYKEWSNFPYGGGRPWCCGGCKQFRIRDIVTFKHNIRVADGD